MRLNIRQSLELWTGGGHETKYQTVIRTVDRRLSQTVIRTVDRRINQEIIIFTSFKSRYCSMDVRIQKSTTNKYTNTFFLETFWCLACGQLQRPGPLVLKSLFQKHSGVWLVVSFNDLDHLCGQLQRPGPLVLKSPKFQWHNVTNNITSHLTNTLDSISNSRHS